MPPKLPPYGHCGLRVLPELSQHEFFNSKVQIVPALNESSFIREMFKWEVEELRRLQEERERPEREARDRRLAAWFRESCDEGIKRAREHVFSMAPYTAVTTPVMPYSDLEHVLAGLTEHTSC